MSLHTIHQLDPVQSSIEQHNNSISSSRNSISNSIDNKSTNDDQDHQMIDDDQTVAIKQESNSQNMIITPEIVSLMSSTQMGECFGLNNFYEVLLNLIFIDSFRYLWFRYE